MLGQLVLINFAVHYYRYLGYQYADRFATALYGFAHALACIGLLSLRILLMLLPSAYTGIVISSSYMPLGWTS